MIGKKPGEESEEKANGEREAEENTKGEINFFIEYFSHQKKGISIVKLNNGGVLILAFATKIFSFIQISLQLFHLTFIIIGVHYDF